MRNKKVRAVCLVLGLLLGPLSYLGALQLTGNFHTVIPGELYRSAQPTGDDIARDIREHGIKSVLNLRGPHPGEAWYDEELATSARLGIRHFDLPLSAKRELNDPEVARLETAMRDAPKPLLVHCKSGADRAGLAASLYLLIRGRSADDAGTQLSLIYGHFPFLGSRSVAMDRTFERVALHTPSR